MLHQTDIIARDVDLTNLYSDLSVKIHGYIMSVINSELAKKCHNGQLQPFSIYSIKTAGNIIIRISALTDEAEPIIDVVARSSSIDIVGIQGGLIIERVVRYPDADLSSLVDSFKYNSIRLHFATPAMFRSAGFQRHIPDIPTYFESVIQKLKLFEDICISKDDIKNAINDVKFRDYSLYSDRFLTGSRYIYGMKGKIDAILPSSGCSSDILRTVISYATYSGVGGQTTQGMGGFFIERLSQATKNR